ncbi:GTPase IMAP family member 5 [Dissostichus eleginoides]|uniref:GTPase IMAP family member 5 n=1 Tax=Dissostichus eleginoides TaxID=100907 RepID=A0AAD9ENF7_DISEL|nr:GTPase IMAP family member 5 [Dissostichus eleginoides]
MSTAAAELRLVVLGRDGAGNRSAVCSILGLQDSEQGTETPVIQESSKHRGEAAGRQVEVVSSGSWFGSGCDPEERRRNISSFISRSSPGPHAFLLCLSLNQPTDGEAVALQVLDQLLGSSAIRTRTFILFTHTEELQEDETLEEYLLTWRKDLLQLVEKCGERYHTLERGERAVEELMEKVEQVLLKWIFSRPAGLQYIVPPDIWIIITERCFSTFSSESGEKHFSCDLYREAEERVRRRQEEMVKQRKGDEEITEEDMLSVRDEAERSAGDLELDVDHLFPSEVSPDPPSFLWGLWEKLIGWVRWLPTVVRREALLGALVRLFVGGPVGGMVGATVGSVATEVGRRRTQKTK